jgi:hypothetical protein
MDCDFCSVTPVVYLHVPTTLGKPADLCRECAEQYYRRPQTKEGRPRESRPKIRNPKRSYRNV